MIYRWSIQNEVYYYFFLLLWRAYMRLKSGTEGLPFAIQSVTIALIAVLSLISYHTVANGFLRGTNRSRDALASASLSASQYSLCDSILHRQTTKTERLVWLFFYSSEHKGGESVRSKATSIPGPEVFDLSTATENRKEQPLVMSLHLYIVIVRIHLDT